ncbi:MAG TPA: VOC family protein [Nocardioidaceae bacterium]|nr:VOC family protein [Nocardioidaceae bacterium]
MRVQTFSHVAITVSDFNEAVRFYWDVFGAPVVGVSDTPSDRVRTFFGVDVPEDDPEPTCKIGWVRIPGGATIEIFEFVPHEPPVDVVWNRLGPTHISFNVRGTQRWHDYLVSKGVEIVSLPEQSPHGHTFFFCKDPDGNLIELIDNKHMRHVLQWLGPLGGVLFRHTLYKRYYQPK